MPGPVIFYGAGATKSCGGPMTNEILPAIVGGLPVKLTLLPGSAGRVVLWTVFFLLAAGSCSAQNPYDQIVLADGPVGFWDISAMDTNEPDLTSNGNNGTYINGLPPIVVMPNGDVAADFNGSNQYLNVPSDPGGAFSIPTTATLTWEAWIRPDVLDFPNENKGYVSYLGKCDSYSPTCEWEARMYGLSTDRPNRLSAYAFNPTAGLGSGAFWQPVSNLFQPSEWLHVVGEYTLLSQPDVCQNASMYPGSIDIWVNGVKWNQSTHGQTGCMSQYNVIPQANTSALNIGTMAGDSWFPGAIAKVAIYNYPLTQDQITAHYTAMIGLPPPEVAPPTAPSDERLELRLSQSRSNRSPSRAMPAASSAVSFGRM